MTGSFDRSEADFRRARLGSFVHRIRAALSGHTRDLLAWDQVRTRLRLGGPIYRGLQVVPVRQIVGSLDRYRDFDRLFLPTQSHTAERWRKINRAWYDEVSLPPVQLVKVGEAYFVIDGNHRLSVARQRGQEFIDAEVREVSARVPVSPDLSADDLERLGERVEFFERTQIDRLLPEAEVRPTILGGYDRLIEHIAVHRYFMGIDLGRAVAEDEAVTDWYAQLYAPVVRVVERSGVTADFPGRTSTDIYLWVMDHLHYLRSREAADEVGPAEAAEDFLDSLTKD